MKYVKLFFILSVAAFSFITCDSTKPFTLYFDVASEDGEGVYFYVYELNTYEEAKEVIQGFKGYYNENVAFKNAEEVAQEFLYLESYSPVCARVLDEEDRDYENDYNFKGQVFLRAHEDGKAYGYYRRGSCKLECGGIANLQCPKGYYCDIKESYPDAMGQCEEIPCPSVERPDQSFCPNGKFAPVYDDNNICVMGWECVQHKPVCKNLGTRSEGWYWGDTGEFIKYDFCEGTDIKCINIGTRSEGWSIMINDHVLFDFCAEEVGVDRPMY